MAAGPRSGTCSFPRRKGRVGYAGDLLACALLAHGALALVPPNNELFVRDLETCIERLAVNVSASSLTWANRCMSVTAKTGFQREVLKASMDPMYEKHGYTGALWCAFYAVRMADQPFIKPWCAPLSRSPPAAAPGLRPAPPVCALSRR
jgi:hypothetical protein